MQDGDFFGGIGNDSIIGTPLADRIFGGDGNDVLVGGDGVDFIYGEAGNDTIGDATPGADDAGDDFYFGGDGSDLFIWEPGDGQDTISGGDDGADRFEFRGNGTDGDQFNLTSDDAHVDASLQQRHRQPTCGCRIPSCDPNKWWGGNCHRRMICSQPKPGRSKLTCQREGPVATADSIIVEGRNTADHVNLNSINDTVVIEGLAYDVLS